MKKLLVISSAVAMLALSGSAYAGNRSTQVGIGTFFTAQNNFQLGNHNKSTQVAVHTAFTARTLPRLGGGTRALK